jgi:hypothetical protein
MVVVLRRGAHRARKRIEGAPGEPRRGDGGRRARFPRDSGAIPTESMLQAGEVGFTSIATLDFRPTRASR